MFCQIVRFSQHRRLARDPQALRRRMRAREERKVQGELGRAFRRSSENEEDELENS
jgi:hypothetical protein